VGVFPHSTAFTHYRCRSSPRSWGCFLSSCQMPAIPSVFPTLVGVFLPIGLSVGYQDRLPHARGGVSSPLGMYTNQTASSPRSWGCFPASGSEEWPRGVFPTLVGVFPKFHRSGGIRFCLPHARGGVSRS